MLDKLTDAVRSGFSLSMSMCLLLGGLGLDSHRAQWLFHEHSQYSVANKHDYQGAHHYSLVAQTVKHLSTMRETRVQSLGQEDLLEKAIANSCICLCSCLENTIDGGAW